MISQTNAIIRKTPHSKDFNVHVNRLKPYHKLEEDETGYLNNKMTADGDNEINEDDLDQDIKTDKLE